MPGIPILDKKRIIAVSERLYRGLLIAYPEAFRQQYGSQMTQVFLDCCREAYQRNGTRGVLRLWISTLGDLITTASVEHVSSLLQKLKRQRVLFNIQASPTLQRQGGGMLHITNGDSVRGTLRQTDLPGDILTWRDIGRP